MGSEVTRARLDAEPENRFARLGRELGLSALGFNVITLEPRQRLRIHVHADQEEVYAVLEGALTLVVEGEETTYATGDVVRVPPPLKRQIVNRGPDRLRLIAVGGAGEHERWDATAYRSWDNDEGGDPRDIPFPEDLPANE